MSKIPKSIQLYRMRAKSYADGTQIVNGILMEIIHSLSAENDFCRICRLGDSTLDSLIQCPCVCIGSIGHIHVDCYRLWRKVTGRNICEICKHTFRRIGNYRSKWEIAVLRTRRFFSSYYSVDILKRSLYIASTIPLIRYNTIDVFNAVNGLHLFELTVCEMTMFTYLLMSADFLFTTHLLWTIENVSRLEHLLNRWWHDIDDMSFEMTVSPHSSFESLFDAFIFY